LFGICNGQLVHSIERYSSFSFESRTKVMKMAELVSIWR